MATDRAGTDLLAPDIDALRSPSAADRRAAILRLMDQGAGLDAIRPLLADDTPYVFVRDGKRLITELRADALVAMQRLCALNRRPPDFGPQLVRRAMPVGEAMTQADVALRELKPAHQKQIIEQADRELSERARPPALDRIPLRAYRVLQLLAKLPYQEQATDPLTYETPLQAQIRTAQARTERPRPHLCVKKDGQVLGFIYRIASGVWVWDFVEGRDAARAERFLRKVLTIQRGGVPRIPHSDGQPQRSADGAFVFDGVIPNDTPDPTQWLQTLSAFASGRYEPEIVT